MKKFSNYLLTLLFLGFLFAIGVYVQISPDKPISFNENRSLAQKPAVSAETVIDGTFTQQYETYFTDQFAGRDVWVQGYLRWQQLTNQTFLSNYYVHEDNWVYPRPLGYFAGPSIDISTQRVQELESYAKENGIEMFFFSLPARVISLEAPYPSYIDEGYEKKNKEYFLEKLPKEHLKTVDLGAAFEKKFSQEELRELYFQTDHHWNIDGAFEGYQVIFDALNGNSELVNEPPLNLENFQKQCYPDENFIGSYNKQLYEMVDTSDEACTITPTSVDFNDFEVYAGEVRADLKVPWRQIYSRDLEKGAAYVEYSGTYTGDHRELNIINPLKKDEGTKVLFLKDSYANPLTMLLSQHFYQTTFYDIRYNQDRTLYEFLEKHDYDMIAFLYNDITIFPGMYDFHLAEK